MTDSPNDPLPIDPGPHGWDLPIFNPMFYLYNPVMLLHQPLALVATGFWVWMLIHCARFDPERRIWLWILFIGNAPAALVYFFVRWLPGANVSAGSALLSRWKKSRQIPRLEAAARHIGNCHQFVELGEAYRETRQPDRAAECFKRALAKDATHLPALWGAAQTAILRDDLVAARPHLEQILERDGSYKFGDVSLAYCRTLVRLGETGPARARLEQHLKRWTHPEAYVLIASILIDQGDYEPAREYLEATLSDLSGGPAFFARQNRGWARKARKLLARLPA